MDQNGKQFRIGGYEIDIIVHGFPGKSVCHGSLGFSTIALIRHGDRIALVDVGSFGQRHLLQAQLAERGLKPADVTDILLTHSHGDHVGDAEAIAAASGAKVIGVFDHLKSLNLPEGAAMGGNPGGKFKVGDVTVNLVPAMHSSSPGGRPLGYVVQFADGRSLYDTGDTWIFGDMALIDEIFSPNIVLLQAGGGPYNQDPGIAALAIKKYFKADVVIPMHYGTWPILSAEADVKAELGGTAGIKIMQPGDSADF